MSAHSLLGAGKRRPRCGARAGTGADVLGAGVLAYVELLFPLYVYCIPCP